MFSERPLDPLPENGALQVHLDPYEGKSYLISAG
jgi:hypothetical protein